ncbi:amidase [Pochonia chlamydosporia 170]|uniref:Amidase n=1 Tax=Pochonia chlamydosporia 170 TaxID=1380566 RepID=A0A179FIQ9_METCM|nr:amidase [Pochonia chlamydosporia 170]OAQ65525.1 amidase [Pochonia chlamydosporia 170]
MIHESQLPRSCDRCHSLKERCRRANSINSCERCTRLRLTCTSNRPFKRPGRRPQPYHIQGARRQRGSESLDPAVDISEDRKGDILAIFNIPEKLSEEEAWLVHRTLANNSFIEQFLLGPSFCNAHRKSLFSQLCKAPALLQDAYVACVLSVPYPGEDPSGTLTEQRLDSSYRRASAALAKLRTLKVENASDVSSCLALGGSILTFVLRFGGKDSLAICSRVLGLIRPVYESHTNKLPDADLGFLACVVMCETTECLLQTELPTLRFRPQPLESSEYVDRYVGLCGTLLPHLQELCHLSFAMFHSTQAKEEVMGELQKLKTTIEAWRPIVPPNFTESYTTSEVTNILCQTHVMQLAALLILHRMQHPFGTEQIAALSMAHTILRQLEVAKMVAGRTPRCIDFALMAACLEVSDGRERSDQLRSASSIAVYSPRFIQRSETFISAVWEARSLKQSPIYWYHLGLVTKHVNVAELSAI